MNKQETLDLLDRLIKMTQDMTQEEWEAYEERVGANKKSFNPNDYIDKGNIQNEEPTDINPL